MEVDEAVSNYDKNVRDNLIIEFRTKHQSILRKWLHLDPHSWFDMEKEKRTKTDDLIGFVKQKCVVCGEKRIAKRDHHARGGE